MQRTTFSNSSRTSASLGLDQASAHPPSPNVGSRQSAHVPRPVLTVLGLALALGLFGGASYAQTVCTTSTAAVVHAVGSRDLSDEAKRLLVADCTALKAFQAELTLKSGSGLFDSLQWRLSQGMHTWRAIKLHPSTRRVTHLTLGHSFNATGELPDLGALDGLTHLRITHNELSGSIPSLSKLTSLQHLRLNDNELSGSIPSLSGLTKLKTLDLSRNELTGRIPSLTGLAELETLALSRNKLTGSIPALNGITTLRWVDLNDNNLTGGIPTLSALVKLERFNVGNNFRFTRGVANNLTGEIPALSTLVALKHLRLNDNKLTGEIPTLPSGNNLQEISAHFNSLTGGIPSIASTGMRVLNLRGNDMTGNINNATAATGIRRLLLGSNGFSGAIPATLDSLTNLEHLSLCGNSLTGGLPSATSGRLTPGDGGTAPMTMYRCLDVADAEVNEGEAVNFVRTYSRFPLTSGVSQISVQLRTQNGTATTADYQPLSNSLLASIVSAADGSAKAEWTLPAVSTKTDCVVEGPETFTMDIVSYSLDDILWSYGGTATINNVAPAASCPPPPDPEPEPEPDPDPDPEEPPDPDRFVAPYWRGTGGIVVKPVNGLSVKFEMSCRGARTRETLYANDDGLIVQLVRRGACTDDDGNPVRSEVSVRDIEPGGWYWIDGPRNAAVAPLISEVDLGGAVATVPAGVEAEVTDNGTFFTHDVENLIGIVPHLPRPDDAACSEYVKPYWRGAGGIVVKPTDGESVELQTTCSGVTTTQTLQANDDGLVVQLLREDSNSCTDAAGDPIASEVSVEGARPGGWYWIDGPRNAGVAPLVCPGLLLGPAATVPVGVDADQADDGTLFEHHVARLIGIVPHLRGQAEESGE